jgi:hypothetical protein
VKLKGEYSGAMIHNLLKGFESESPIVAQILAHHHLDHIDPNGWYPLDIVHAAYTDIRNQIGPQVLYTAGMNVASKTPALLDGKSPRGVLSTLDQRYRSVVRGPNIGGIECSFEEDGSAVLSFTSPFPCAFFRGILKGYCARSGTPTLLEHGQGGCVDDGGDACTFRVSW